MCHNAKLEVATWPDWCQVNLQERFQTNHLIGDKIMDLKQEIQDLLKKAKDSGEYFNPYFLAALIETLEGGEFEVDDDLHLWVRNMWSR